MASPQRRRAAARVYAADAAARKATALAGAYPFLAEGGLGSDGAFVGADKSSLAKSLYTRSIPFGRRVYVPGDPKGEHIPVAEAVGGGRS